MTQDRDPEISENTRALIDGLGRQSRASGAGRTRDDDNLRFYLRSRDYYDEEYRLSRGGSGRDAGTGPPSYLVPAARAIAQNANVRVWLHGEDPDERDRACAWLAAFAEIWGWEPVTLRLRRPNRFGFDYRTERGELIARNLIMAWRYPNEARVDLNIAHTARPSLPLAIILRDPGLMTKRRIDLLARIARSVRRESGGSLVAVCSEAPPDADIPEFQPILCESHLSAVGRRIAALRTRRGISRSELATMAGIPTQLLAMLESGIRREQTSAPDEAEFLMARLADALRVPRQQLLQEEVHDE